MGSSNTDAPPKAPKASAAQEQPPATSSSPTSTVYPDWSGFQHLMSAYGTPPPPYVMYPHGGLYAHPSIPPGSHPFNPYAVPSTNGNPEVSGAVAGGSEGDGKSSEGKERSPIKRSKGSLGSLNMITGKNSNDRGKTSRGANGVFSQSSESGSEGSSDGSDANSQNDSQPKMNGGQDSFDAEASQNGTTACGSQNGIACAPTQATSSQTIPIMTMPAAGVHGGVVGPTTNLNIGMDYWNASAPSPMPPIRGKAPGATGAGPMVPGGLAGSREVVPSDLWIQVLVTVTIIYFRVWPIQTGDMNMIQSSPDVMHVNNHPLESGPQELYYHGSQDMAVGVVIGFIFVEPGGCNKQAGHHAMVFLGGLAREQMVVVLLMRAGDILFKIPLIP